MQGVMTEAYDAKINDFFYDKGEMVEVTELSGFPKNFAVYRDGTLDWVPKHLIQLMGC